MDNKTKEAIKFAEERMESGEISIDCEEYEALKVMTDYCKRGVEIGKVCPNKLKIKDRNRIWSKSGPHQSEMASWDKEMFNDVYNQARADIIHWVNSRLSEVEEELRLQLVGSMDLFFEWGRRTFKHTDEFTHKNTSDIIEKIAKRLFDNLKKLFKGEDE